MWTGAVLIVGLIGLSRLYLGADWLTGVLGGIALGALWLFVLLALDRNIWPSPSPSHSPSAEPRRRAEPGPVPRRRLASSPRPWRAELLIWRNRHGRIG